jgi:hypothetical protein
MTDDVFEHVIKTEFRLYGWSYAAQYDRPSRLLGALKDRALRENNRERQAEFSI